MKRFLLAFLALGLLCTLLVDARSVEWRHDRYSLYASNQDLADTLRDFCAAQGVTAVISPGVAGTVSGRFEDMAPADFLDLLAQTYALSWYYDGHVLYVYRADETQSRMLKLTHIHPERLKTTLSRLALWDDRFAWRTVEEEGLLHVSGPPRLVQLVEETALYLEGQAAREQQATEVVRVFPLRHAWADDLTLSFLKREVTVPGVASTLRAIMTEQAGGGGRTARRLPATATGLKGTGLAAVNRDGSAESAAAQGGAATAQLEGASEALATGSGIQARIMADTRLNAVVIRDAREKMPLYETLIQELDVAVGVIEIQAAIIDVNVDFSRELGVNWRFGTSVRDGFLSTGGLDVSEGLRPDAMDTLIQGSGLNISTLYADSVYNLLTRIHALENQGNAQVLSRPTVLTLDNVEAHIENTRTLHIRLTGEREVDLFKVDTGTVLEVTPRIIKEDGRRRIKLLVSIRDGTYSATTSVDDIPEILESAINTQAVVELGQSLLLGGFYVQRTQDTQQGIPLLMHLPVLGHAFKTTRKEQQTRERLFLISPRIVEMDADNGQPFPPGLNQGSGLEPAQPPHPPGERTANIFSTTPPGQPGPVLPARRGAGCAPVRPVESTVVPTQEQPETPALAETGDPTGLDDEHNAIPISPAPREEQPPLNASILLADATASSSAMSILPHRDFLHDAATIAPGGDAFPRNDPHRKISGLVEAWVDAWADQDVEKYLDFYASSFIPEDDQNLDAWRRLRGARVSSPSFINIELSDVMIVETDTDTIQVRFSQQYQSDVFADRVRKELLLQQESGQWRIARERVLP